MTDGIRTPETHPDDDVVGHHFKNWGDGHDYYCDSYDPAIGYWMARVDGTRRANVSERVIGRTYRKTRE